ncbi:hypothetical protein EXIGLDRAFT_735172 [Exidia glandulosa HHB12029]|uniref:Endoplasmic reticulum junction formation protein lunapark n=1 Tax=Exidia glandulosa HHB12029 TaxID=1314781 RepID=A0A165ATC9_EXIGL|nr:hypothetical protein EXIGLDRAFT_735172 [Exidia glandulosa HHB12029]
MALLSWFSKKEPENYEEVLSALATEIAQRQARLADIRQRERRATLWFTLYAGAAWAAYVALWYARLVPRASSRAAVERMLAGAPVLAGPLVIVFARRIMQAWYTRIGNAEESTLKRLTVKQRTKIEEIKKATNYYSTKNLLERYDESPKGKGQPQPPQLPGSPAGPRFPGAIPNTPQRPGQPQPAALQQLGVAQAGGGPGSNLLSPVQQPIVPPRRQWYDRLADALLGEEEGDGAGPSGKYALICARCFAHNGLVKESEWSSTKYTCPKCGFFNDAPDAKKPSAPLPIGPRQSLGNGAGFQPFVPPGSASVTRTPRSPLASEVHNNDDEEEEEEDEDVVEKDTSSMDVDLAM